MSSYRVVQPHPTASGAIHTARGGAGNVCSPPDSSPTPGHGASATGPASLARLDPPHARRKYCTTGRGGAGNVHASSECAIFSFDEELEQQLRQERRLAPVIHVGRGGAGNMLIRESRDRSRNITTSSTGRSSSSGAAGVVNNDLSRKWSADNSSSSSSSSTSSSHYSQDEKLKLTPTTTASTVATKSTDSSRWTGFSWLRT